MRIPAALALPVVLTVAVAPSPTMTAATPLAGVASQAADAPAYVAYYWKARPGKLAEYNAYIREVAEPIDEEARKAGVFVEVVTVTPVVDPKGPEPEWTHLRIFTLRNLAAVGELSPGLDAATARVVPSEAQRKANAERSAPLRDLVRREVWTALR
ncbi:MAG: hypothetical protein AB1635_16855 [Acidobacteriota bacterium]